MNCLAGTSDTSLLSLTVDSETMGGDLHHSHTASAACTTGQKPVVLRPRSASTGTLRSHAAQAESGEAGPSSQTIESPQNIINESHLIVPGNITSILSRRPKITVERHMSTSRKRAISSEDRHRLSIVQESDDAASVRTIASGRTTLLRSQSSHDFWQEDTVNACRNPVKRIHTIFRGQDGFEQSSFFHEEVTIRVDSEKIGRAHV